jgi:PmbA protein
MDKELTRLAETAVQYALGKGAEQVAVSVSQARFVELKRRERRTETLQASTTRGLRLSLYADGCFTSNGTSVLEKEALENFIDESLTMTKLLAPDHYRGLADPRLYGALKHPDLDLHDQEYERLTMDEIGERVAAAEEASLLASKDVISATASFSSQESESIQLHSNGFLGNRKSTGFYLGSSVSVKDEVQGRRPEDYYSSSARHLEDLPAAASIGAEAARRAMGRIGAQKVASQTTTLVVENRAVSKLLGSLFSPLGGAALQQKRSCFEGALGQRIGSDLLHITDCPLIPRALGSRSYDGDGLPQHERPLFSEGFLQNYFIDIYYGRKLNMSPTGGGTSNVIMRPGDKSLDELIGAVETGILVSGFLGGNANPATGDFSFGISGFQIVDGKLAQPISEMNIADNQRRLWHRLVGVGNDPYAYSAWRLPSVVFEGVSVAGV